MYFQSNSMPRAPTHSGMHLLEARRQLGRKNLIKTEAQNFAQQPCRLHLLSQHQKRGQANANLVSPTPLEQRPLFGKPNSPRHNELRRGPAQCSDHNFIFSFSRIPGHHQVQTHQVSQVYSSFHELLKHKAKLRSRQAKLHVSTPKVHTHTTTQTQQSKCVQKAFS